MAKKPTLKPFLALFSAILLLAISPDSASADDLKWSPVNIPSNGVAGKWVLAEGSDVRYPTLASDGTIYCYANPTGTPFRLFKSTDSGYSWSYTGRVEEAAVESIVDIAVVPNNPNCVYFATTSRIFKSSDAGNRFDPLASSPGQAGIGNVKITSFDVTSANGTNYIVVGTRDSDPSKYGGIYWLAEGQSVGWEDTALGDYDVSEVTFSSQYIVDHQIVAVTTNEIDTFVTTNINNAGWGLRVGNARIPGIVAVSAAVVFPDGYDSEISRGKYNQFFALNTGTGNGDVYSLTVPAGGSAPIITDLDAGKISGLNSLDITSLAVSGNADNAYLISGATLTAKIYCSADSGHQWSYGTRPPSGNSRTYVLMAANFASSGIIFAATSGPESAFSVSRDRGITWNQTGLIDTKISSIQDLAVSPDYDQDKTLFLLTANVQNSLWYTHSGGDRWQRIFYGLPNSGERMDLVLLSPQYSSNKKVFLAGTVLGSPVIWKSEDGGQNFVKANSIDPQTEAPVEINCWAITTGDRLFVGSFDGAYGTVYQTGANGLPYIDRGKVGTHVVNSVVLSPDYGNDHTILVGDTFGSVYYSVDNGLVFQPLPLDAVNPPFTGSVSVAFDPNFSRNKVVYAASNNPNAGIYRFIIGQSRSWETIDKSLPQGAKIGKLVASTNGLLYGVNTQTIDSANRWGGIERSLDSGTTVSPTFETVNSGLDNGCTINKLWIRGNTLWTVEVNLSNSLLFTYSDSLNSPVTLTTPANNAIGLSSNVTIQWAASAGATGYHWQVDTDTQFSYIPNGFEGETDFNAVRLPNLVPNTTYYWRVKASQPISSPWSSIWSFNTQAIAAPKLSEPRSSSLSSINPIFKWTASEGAEKYELMVSRDDKFTDLAIHKSGDNACNSNVWVSDITLTYNNSYYWRVRAICGTYQSQWSEANIFTTEPAPSPAPVPTPNPSPLVAPRLSEPRSSSPSAITPIFKWTAVEGAQRYELVVSLDDAFSNLVINQICNANVWQSNIALAYNTGYYWKVRTISGDSKSAWSDVGIFITAPASSPSPPAGNSQPSAPNSSPKPSASAQPTSTPTATKPTSPPTSAVSPTNSASVAETPISSKAPTSTVSPPTQSSTTPRPSSQPGSNNESSHPPKATQRSQSNPDAPTASVYLTGTGSPSISSTLDKPLNWTLIILIGSLGIIAGGVVVSILMHQKKIRRQ